jgi:hypothetical protein
MLFSIAFVIAIAVIFVLVQNTSNLEKLPLRTYTGVVDSHGNQFYLITSGSGSLRLIALNNASLAEYVGKEVIVVGVLATDSQGNSILLIEEIRLA